VHKLRTASKDPSLLQPEELVETLLVESDASRHLPTDPSRLLGFLQLEQLTFDFAKELDFVEPQKADKLRAALSINERVVATQSGMSKQRTRFSIFHEIGHYILPDHMERIFLDNDKTLSWWSRVRMERDANQVAADLLFQGNRFSEEAGSMPISIKTILNLAPQYGASIEAALRRYTERHIAPCALIVFEKVSRSDESYVEDDEYQIQYTITSEPFRKQYFSGQLTCEPCKTNDIYDNVKDASIGNTAETEAVIEAGSHKWRFASEVFNNSYNIFQFLNRQIK
jgi:Zn-dependent peptidase ImmA (M78 family)